MKKRRVHPGTVQETLLIPLYGRAVENRKAEAALRDPRAEEIVAALDHDFSRFEGLASLTGSVMRTRLFDHWTSRFLREHPAGTVVEVGAGLNSRFERVDNGAVHWLDLDLPDVVELRRAFFPDTARRTTVAASVTEHSWMDAVTERSQEGGVLFCAEAVLPFLDESEVRGVIDGLADRFPGSLLALDLAGHAMVDTQDEHDALSKVEARMRWTCDGPEHLTAWHPGIEVLACHTLSDPPPALYAELPPSYQRMITDLATRRLPQVEEYRLALLRLSRTGPGRS
ncbi:class I SAM-dependent methyltransferase [Streptomyces sp. NPDC050560]|uniref:class I SAM-dependent methyltransferase n=1 Tax=Streptomyces sp. NPDC050560 TaxID=3365630 RepID=UPI00378FE4D9